MTRGLTIPVTEAEIAARASSLVGLRLLSPGGRLPPLPMVYRLGAGGKDPSKPHPGEWSPLGRRWLCDCSALSSWALGCDRLQPSFPGRWLNTDGMLEDAARGGSWFAFEDVPRVGGLVVYGSIRAHGKRVRVGHVAIVVRVPAEFDPRWSWRDTRVVHCSSSASRGGDAIIESDATLWQRRQGRWLRYLRAS